MKQLFIMVVIAFLSLNALAETRYSPKISSYWKLTGSMDDAWVEFINRPISDMSMRLSGKDPQGEDITIDIVSRGQYLSLRRRGFHLPSDHSHYEIKCDFFLNMELAGFLAIRNAKPAHTSYVRDIRMDKFSMADMPGTLTPTWDATLEDVVEADPDRFPNIPPDFRKRAREQDVDPAFPIGENRPSYLEMNPEATNIIKSADAVSFYAERIDSTEEQGRVGYGFSLTILGWGDINGDGIEDLICRYGDVYIGGTGGYTYLIALTRLSKDGPLFQIPIKSTPE